MPFSSRSWTRGAFAWNFIWQCGELRIYARIVQLAHSQRGDTYSLTFLVDTAAGDRSRKVQWEYLILPPEYGTVVRSLVWLHGLAQTKRKFYESGLCARCQSHLFEVASPWVKWWQLPSKWDMFCLRCKRSPIFDLLWIFLVNNSFWKISTHEL